jgi:hypothetical protein
MLRVLACVAWRVGARSLVPVCGGRLWIWICVVTVFCPESLRGFAMSPLWGRCGTPFPIGLLLSHVELRLYRFEIPAAKTGY